jgi:hypothetical protein
MAPAGKGDNAYTDSIVAIDPDRQIEMVVPAGRP